MTSFLLLSTLIFLFASFDCRHSKWCGNVWSDNIWSKSKKCKLKSNVTIFYLWLFINGKTLRPSIMMGLRQDPIQKYCTRLVKLSNEDRFCSECLGKSWLKKLCLEKSLFQTKVFLNKSYLEQMLFWSCLEQKLLRTKVVKNKSCLKNMFRTKVF